MTTPHTPGPWKYNLDGCPTSMGLPIVQAKNGHLIADLCTHNEGNARLIAAAPEMAELLRQLQHESALSASWVRQIQNVLYQAGALTIL